MEADQCGVETMAMPAVGTGSFKFPKDDAAKVMLSTLVDYIDNNKTGLKRIIINLMEFDRIGYSQKLTQDHFQIYRTLLQS
jgi:O-acetyl-ADP-ribose deacetylase (regulator of RNase III)